jgi:DsbC/DsbD-like thiol-disulfide interchange protein
MVFNNLRGVFPGFLKIRILAAMLLALTGFSQASAQNVIPSLFFESTSPSAGSKVRAAVVFRPKTGWHTYWTNPGDAGAAPRASWNAPDGLIFTDFRHPAPSRLSVQGITSFVHKGDHALLFDVQVSSGLPLGTPLPIVLELDWLSCSSSQCVPERATLKAVLVVGTGETDFAGLSRVRAGEARIPVKSDEVEIQAVGNRIEFFIPRKIESPLIFPADDDWFRTSDEQTVSYTDSGTRIAIESSKNFDPLRRFQGVIAGKNESFSISSTIVSRPIERDDEQLASSTLEDQAFDKSDEGVSVAAGTIDERDDVRMVDTESGSGAVLPTRNDLEKPKSERMQGGIAFAGLIGGLFLVYFAFLLSPRGNRTERRRQRSQN